MANVGNAANTLRSSVLMCRRHGAIRVQAVHHVEVVLRMLSALRAETVKRREHGEALRVVDDVDLVPAIRGHGHVLNLAGDHARIRRGRWR